MTDPWLLSISASNFRCFRDTGELALRPVTILVGENSSGKSSLLALARLASEITFPQSNPFNRPPFFLGSFNEIAFNIGGKNGRNSNFTIGSTIRAQNFHNFQPHAPEQFEAKVRFELANRNSQPIISRATVELSSTERVTVALQASEAQVTHTRDGEDHGIKFPLPDRLLEGTNNLLDVLFEVRANVLKTMPAAFQQRLQDALRMVESVIFTSRGEEVFAANPMRSNPKRTYDPVSSAPEADSNYALQSLASLKRTKRTKWLDLKESIDQAGKASRLFNAFDIRLLGKNESDPFQASVKIGGKVQNLVDVGFGVSQMIPIIYDLNVVTSSLVLVQQPETHLHPAAQVGLGEVIALLPRRKRGQTYMIETHSDYLIDAIRIAVRQGKAKSSDFAIWFTERKKSEAVVHQMALDESGTIINQPDSYRDFFMNHQGRLFGIY